MFAGTLEGASILEVQNNTIRQFLSILVGDVRRAKIMNRVLFGRDFGVLKRMHQYDICEFNV